MSGFFSVEGPLFSGLDRLADLFWLNILFVLCSVLGLGFTVGASATAMYYVTLKMVKNEESHITKSFFKAFKSNFRQSTVIWLIAEVVGFILFADFMIMSGRWYSFDMPDMLKKSMIIFLFVVGLVYALTLRYVFPLLARFDNTIKNTIKNAFIISIRHLPFSALLLLFVVGAVVLFVFVPTLRITFFIITFSLIAFVSSYIFVKIFAYYMPKEEEKDPDAFVLGGDDQDTQEMQ